MPRSKLSRRRFLALVAAGSTVPAGAAVAADSTPPARKKSPARAKPVKTPVYAPPPAPSAEIARGIAQQKEWLASSLETLRKFDLEPGSEQGFAFRPLESKRRKT